MRRGLALFVVVGILGVMAVLGTAFALMARLERTASQRRVHATRALLLARSGLEDAVARLSAGQAPASVGGRARGYSGAFGSEAVPLLSYALRVEDESAKINVNGGLLDGEDRDADGIPDHRDADVRPATATANEGWGWNDQLARVLEILGRQPELRIPTLATDILARRPAGGFGSIGEVQAAVSATTDLSRFLTVSSWIDRKVIRPNVRNASNRTDPSRVKKEQGPPAFEEGGRPPVNLNAASRPVLIALLQGIQGSPLWARSRNEAPSIMQGATVMRPLAAASVSDQMILSRPFVTWNSFNAWVETLHNGAFQSAAYGSGSEATTPGAADLLKANFDPNSMLRSLAPDQIRWRWIDKSSLLAYSTEGSLGPTGIFRLSSLGRIRSPSGALLAEASASSVVEVFSQLRQTTQRDFVAGRRLEEYLSPANPSPAFPIPVQRTTGASASWKPASWLEGQGLGAMRIPARPPPSPPKRRISTGPSAWPPWRRIPARRTSASSSTSTTPGMRTSEGRRGC